MRDSFHLEGGGATPDIRVGNQKQNLTPTLMIGLGGTGKEVLMGVRKRFFLKHQEPGFGITRYLWVDTNTKELADSGDLGALERGVDWRNEEKIDLAVPGATIQQILNGPGAWPHVYEWAHPHMLREVRNGITTGAGQIRGAGKLAFSLGVEALQQAFEHAIRQIRLPEARDRTRLLLHDQNLDIDLDRLEIFVVASLAGGTGSGMFLDTAYLLREILSGAEHAGVMTHVTAVLLLPGVYEAGGNVHQTIKANGYAALKELEYYSSYLSPFEKYQMRIKADNPDARIPDNRPFTTRWRPNFPAKPNQAAPFDTCYLVDNAAEKLPAERGKKAIVGLCDMLSDFIHADFLVNDFGMEKRSARANLSQYLTRSYRFGRYDAQERSIFTRMYPTRYSSFGMAKIHVDRERLTNASTYYLAMNVMRVFAGMDEEPSASKDQIRAAIGQRVRSELHERGASPAAILRVLQDDPIMSLGNLLEKDLDGDTAHVRGADAEKGWRFLQSRRSHYTTAVSVAEGKHGAYAAIPMKNVPAIRDRAVRAIREVLSDVALDPKGRGLVDAISALEVIQEDIRKQRVASRDLATSVPPGGPQRDAAKAQVGKLLAHLREARELPILSRRATTIVGDRAHQAVEEFQRLRTEQIRYVAKQLVHKSGVEVFNEVLHEIGTGRPDADADPDVQATGIFGRLVECQALMIAAANKLQDAFDGMSAVSTDYRSVNLPQKVNYAQIVRDVLDPGRHGDFADIVRGQGHVKIVREALVNHAPQSKASESSLDRILSYGPHSDVMNVAFSGARELLVGKDAHAVGSRFNVVREVFEHYPSDAHRKDMLLNCILHAQPRILLSPQYASEVHTHGHAQKPLLSIDKGTTREEKNQYARLIKDFGELTRPRCFREGPESYAEGGSEDSILIYGEYAGLPVFALGRLEDWKRSYLDEVRAKSIALRHSEADYERFPDIVPVEEQVAAVHFRAMKAFFGGVLLGLVQYDGQEKCFQIGIKEAFGTIEIVPLGRHLEQVQEFLVDTSGQSASPLKSLQNRIAQTMREVDASELWAANEILRRYWLAEVAQGGKQKYAEKNAQLNCFFDLGAEFRKELERRGLVASEEAFEKQAEALRGHTESAIGGVRVTLVGPPGFSLETIDRSAVAS